MNYSDIMPRPANLQCAHFIWVTDVNQSASANAWRTLTLNTEVYNDITDCSISGSQITLGTGVYHVAVHKNFQRTNHSRVGIYDVTNAAMVIQGVNTYHYTSTSEGYGACACEGILEVTGTTVFESRYFTRSNGSNGLGSNSSVASDVRNIVTITRLV